MSTDALAWDSDPKVFESAVIGHLRQDDDIPLRLLAEQAPSVVLSLASGQNAVSPMEAVLDRLVTMAAAGIRLDRPAVTEFTVDAMGRTYDIGFRIEAGKASTGFKAPELWLRVLERALGLGALAVRWRRWPLVHSVAVQRADAESWRDGPSAWLRHGLTAAARSRLLVEQKDGRDIELSLLEFARRAAEANPSLHADLPDGADDQLVDSLCQFDALACLAVSARGDGISASDIYPSFARYRTYRTEPAFVRVVSEPAVREAVCPLSDAQLALLLRDLSAMAGRESFRYSGWDGFSDRRLLRFLDEHPAAPT